MHLIEDEAAAERRRGAVPLRPHQQRHEGQPEQDRQQQRQHKCQQQQQQPSKLGCLPFALHAPRANHATQRVLGTQVRGRGHLRGALVQLNGRASTRQSQGFWGREWTAGHRHRCLCT